MDEEEWMMDEFEGRVASYDKDWCWQYNIRLETLKEDLLTLPDGIVPSELSATDFEFKVLETKEEREDAGRFIKRYEWLGKLAFNTTHYFGAYLRGILCGVITMGCPNAFSKCLGEGTERYERLISRGACISWSPKGLASHFMMWCIKWMVANTQYRVFTAYSDPAAKELGTIYQACSFYYLGNRFGASKRYISPYSGRIISDRTFRVRSYYKRYAQDLGIEWDDSWSKGDKVYWDRMPPGVEDSLKEYGKSLQKGAKMVMFPPKHKYAFVMGRGRIETNRLRKRFLQNTKTYEYPKKRGE